MINLSPAQRQVERTRQLRLIDASGRKIRGSLRREFVRVGREAAKMVERAGPSAASRALEGHETRLAEGITRGAVPVILRIGRDVSRGTSKSDQKQDREITQEILAEIASRYLQSRGLPVSRSAATVTSKLLSGIIARGIDQGHSNREIAKEIRSQFTQIARARSETIARTESHTAAMFSSNETMKEAESQATKIWVTAGDS